MQSLQTKRPLVSGVNLCKYKSIINGFCNYYYYYFSILLTFMILLFFFKNDELKEKEKYTSKNFVWKIYWCLQKILYVKAS